MPEGNQDEGLRIRPLEEFDVPELAIPPQREERDEDGQDGDEENEGDDD